VTSRCRELLRRQGTVLSLPLRDGGKAVPHTQRPASRLGHPCRDAEPFRLSRFDRYTNEEIASRLHVSGKAVEYHISQALKKLRLRLDHLIFFIIAMVLLGACA